jgi:hypothetical protein
MSANIGEAATSVVLCTSKLVPKTTGEGRLERRIISASVAPIITREFILRDCQREVQTKFKGFNKSGLRGKTMSLSGDTRRVAQAPDEPEGKKGAMS